MSTMDGLRAWSVLNIFQYCKFLRFLGHIMVLIVLAIDGFSYYAVVVAVYGPMMLHGPVLRSIGCAIAIVAFTACFMMMVWSYFTAVATDPGGVPPGWHPFPDEQSAEAELERMSYSDYYIDRRDPRRPRYCKRCSAWKPERSHHCSVSGRCVLRMDHYCIWVVNCVGLLNYKAFLLFLWYTFLSGLMACLLLIQPVVDFFKRPVEAGPGSAIAFIAVITDGAFAASLGGFLIMHYQLVAANCTSIEMYEKDRIHPWPYNKGFRRNFEEIFGKNKWRWLVPTHTKEERRRLLDTCGCAEGLLHNNAANAV